MGPAVAAGGAGLLVLLLAATELARRHRRRRLRAATSAMVVAAPSFDQEAGTLSPVAMAAAGPSISTRVALADGGTEWTQWAGGTSEDG